jgi:hypothetical protein
MDDEDKEAPAELSSCATENVAHNLCALVVVVVVVVVVVDVELGGRCCCSC